MPPPYPGIYPPPYAYPPGSGGYPQAGPNGVFGYPGAGAGTPPAPPGFNVPDGAASAPPAYDSVPHQYPPGASAQYNGMAQQAPPADSKSGIPPAYNMFQDPFNPQVMYQQQFMSQGPPPPYTPDSHKKEQ
ncbi:hypothetical protein AVEN_227607-1 [Araneus ventricosus]|uniref:Uncharacterized protein n=1 Tax=Araneus ventricosus TaxID=182803 RepID=A0A4Y2JZQ4_ARAVE|nr:hypothetical protein AVEN_227607-1 [Araneus ventricosus]